MKHYSPESSARIVPEAASQREALLAAAESYTDRGWPVLPLHGKVPLVKWKEYRTRLPTREELTSWFTESESPTGIGIVTGKLSRLVVVDCDSREAAKFWESEYGGSPMMVATGGGGVHIYYAMPSEKDVRNRARVLGRKIDIRGEGGYVTAPPSMHSSGVPYTWLQFDAGSNLPVFSSTWLSSSKVREASIPCTPETRKVRNALAYIRRIHAVSGEGGHNATFRAACRLRDAGLSMEEALSVLATWNETNAMPPWQASELEHKICSVFSGEL